jgi:hypothetical protein
MENTKPHQEIRCVWGLGSDTRPCVDLTIVSDYGDLRLMSMDAPDAMPAGSTVKEFKYGGSDEWIRESLTFRDHVPMWRQGGECWENGFYCGNRAR